MSEKPVPTPSEDTAEFWAACGEGRFVVQRCTECEHERFYPASVCPNCWNTEWTDVELSGDGSIESYTAVHYAPSEPFRDDTPYVVALVSMSDDVTVMANVLADPADIAVGEAVSLTWEERDGQRLYQFQPESPES